MLGRYRVTTTLNFQFPQIPSRGNKHSCSRAHEQHPRNGIAKANHERENILDEDTGSRPCGRGHISSCWWCEFTLLLRQATSIQMRTSKVQKSLPVCFLRTLLFLSLPVNMRQAGRKETPAKAVCVQSSAPHAVHNTRTSI